MTRSGFVALCLLVLGSSRALAYEAGDNHKWTPPAFCGYEQASHGDTNVLSPAQWHMTGASELLEFWVDFANSLVLPEPLQ